MFRTTRAVHISLGFRCPDTQTPRRLQAARLLCFRLRSNRNSQGIQAWSVLTKFTTINKCQRCFREFSTPRFSRQGKLTAVFEPQLTPGIQRSSSEANRWYSQNARKTELHAWMLNENSEQWSINRLTNSFPFIAQIKRETAVAQWLRCCVTNRKVAGSIPDGVIGIFHWHNPSDRTMALGSIQPLTEISTSRISWG